MTAVFTLALLALPRESVTAEAVRSAWQARGAEVSSGDLSWRISRDSRSGGFGFSEAEPSRRVWRLRFDRDRCRIDLERLAVDGRDGRVRPAEADPNRARLEFRYVLLEERLAGPQAFPEPRPFSAVLAPDRPLPGDALGVLERLLAEAPLLAWRPLSLIDAARLVVTDRRASVLGRDYPVLEERRPDGVVRELWVEPGGGFRVARAIETSGNRVVGQIDFRYADEASPVPAGWTALRLDTTGDVLEFATAERTELRQNVVVPAGVFEVPSGEAGRRGGSSSYLSRQAMRSLVDWGWLPVLVVITGAAYLLRRRASRPSTDPGNGNGSEAEP